MKSMHLLGDFYHKVQCKQDSKTQKFAKLLACDEGYLFVDPFNANLPIDQIGKYAGLRRIDEDWVAL